MMQHPNNGEKKTRLLQRRRFNMRGSQHAWDSTLYKRISTQIHQCIATCIKVEFFDDKADMLDRLKDLRKCNQRDERVVKKAIRMVQTAKPHIRDEFLYMSTLYYYFCTVVLEYHLTESISIKQIFKALKWPLDHMKLVKVLVMEMTTSDDDWASTVRRILNKWDLVGLLPFSEL